MSRSKRLSGSLTRPGSGEPPKGGLLTPQIHLIQALILIFLLPDVLAYDLCVPPYCGYKVSPRPEVLTYEIALLLSVHTGQVYRALSLDKSEFRRWPDGVDPRICQTFAASPAEPGELLLGRPFIRPQGLGAGQIGSLARRNALLHCDAYVNDVVNTT